MNIVLTFRICGDLTDGGSGFKLKDFSQKNYLGC